jgi:melibiose permease/lactose/raffinose/galactose permease
MDNEAVVSTTNTTELGRVNQFRKNKWLFSLGGIGRDMSYQLISAFLLTYVQFGVSLELAQFTTLSLIIGVGGRLWDAINDPIMGAIIEGSHLKWGKFKPWILIGAVVSGVIIFCMFNVRAFTGWDFVIFMVVLYLLWESTYTMNDIGYWAMLPSLSSKREERNNVTMLTVFFAGVGAFIAQGLVILLTPGNVVKGYGLASTIIVVALIGCQLMTSIGVKETPRLAQEKEQKVSLKHMWKTIKNNDQVLWMTLSMFLFSMGQGLLIALAYNLYYLEVGYDSNSFFFIVVFGVCNVVVNLLYPKLATRLGRKKLQKVSIFTVILGYIGISLLGWWTFLPFNIITLSIFGVLVFSGQTLFYMSSIINMTNCVEYNEYKQGERNEAVVSTLRPFMTKFASAMQYGIVTLVLTISGLFILSQNISLMESQKDYLVDIDTNKDQIVYLTTIGNYLDIYETVQDKDTANKLVAEAIAEDTFMAPYQLKADYVQALGDTRVYRTTYIDGVIVKGSEADLGRWKDMDDADLLVDQGATSYKYSMEIRGKNFNAANEYFKNKGDLKMRLWIRAAVSVFPIFLMFASWYIQKKKFIIDEKYYDMMLKEIDARREENGTAEE